MSLKSPIRQRGLSLATALFVITVMALLAAMIFQLIRSNAESTQEAVLLSRALNAAESGVQFGLNSIFPPEGGGGVCGTENYDPEEDGLSACSVEVICTSIDVASVDYYTVTSTGSCGDISRTVQVRAQ